MTRALARRLSRLETASVSADNAPCVLSIAYGETRADALARFATEHPIVPRHHAVLIVPDKPANDEQHAAFDAAFLRQQLQLVAEARSERLSVEADEDPAEPLLRTAKRLFTDTVEPAARHRGTLGAFTARTRMSSTMFSRISGVNSVEGQSHGR